MKKLTVGILAHVDAGKTTLSEGMLYRAGALRALGRVDHRDTFLDTDAQERERGITIFSKQAELTWNSLDMTLLDTPGHVDFSGEMERTLQVLDCALLVISGADGVQGHTRTLWRLLERYRIPTFLFIGKMDQPGTDAPALMAEMKRLLNDGCVDFGSDDAMEQMALCDEHAMEAYLAEGDLADAAVSDMIARRQLFPCFFGSALKLTGVDALLDGLARYAPIPRFPMAFGARVYKIARDHQGQRLTFLKVTGGVLEVRALLTNRREELPEESVWEEKVAQLRLYSGAKYRAVERVEAGTVCAVVGLSQTKCGEGLGQENDGPAPMLSPVFTYRVMLPKGCDPHTALSMLRQLEEEDPQLQVVWLENQRELHVQLMGEVQLEILSRLLHDRFGLDVTFGTGSILYRETIEAPVEGVGHYEPLRHYAEVHLLLSPLPRGSGLRFAAACAPDSLDVNWQRLILTHLMERTHPGVLTGAPITDMSITLTAGRAHLKHTEGGDFRQATYRAVRQGLMSAKSLLLEPWYDLQLTVPADCLGRAMSDIDRMGGSFAPPETFGQEVCLSGSAPVARVRHYARDVAVYTRGHGQLTCTLRGYEPCADQDALVRAIGYDPEADVWNPADSVFCAHGAGFLVKWYQVPQFMHIASQTQTQEKAPDPPSTARSTYHGTLAEDAELLRIFEQLHGPIKQAALPLSRTFEPPQTNFVEDSGPEYLLVDGYNIIFAWEDLKELARTDLNAARQQLMELLCNYQGFRMCQVILVFDAYKVPHGVGTVEQYRGITVVYTRESQTADSYIERASFDLSRKHRVMVASSDGAEQMIILGHGSLRLSASAFREEVDNAARQIRAILEANNQPVRTAPLRQALADALERRTEKNDPARIPSEQKDR